MSEDTVNMLSFQFLDEPDESMARDLYGVEFMEAPDSVLDSFARRCHELANERQVIVDRHDLDISLSKPAAAYLPKVFLARELTPKQVEVINDNETHLVADYCMDVQKQIAKVPIVENWERMRHIPSAFTSANVDATFSNIPFPDVSGDWAGKPQEFWAREKFAQRLVLMGHLLERCNVQLHFIEAFRPPGVQEGMFRRRIARTKSEHPDWNENQLLNEAKSKTASSPRLASHKGGAAVDVLLRSAIGGNLLNFGHEYPDGGVLVFPRTPYVTQAQWLNRQLLQVVAGLSDLTLYVGEDWHVSYGDNLASIDEFSQVRQDYTAQFGPIKDFSRKNGEIIEIYNPDELDATF